MAMCKYAVLVFLIFTVRNEVAKVMFLQVSVCHSVHRGVCLSACWDTTLRTREPPGPANPPHQQTATVADGTHPTGMHSCDILLY